MGNIGIAYNLCVSLCNKINPPCLYSMDGSGGINGLPRRGGGTFLSDPWLGSLGSSPSNPIQYFDCSGMMSYVLWKAGYFQNQVCFTTFSEEDYLKQAGFTVVDYSPDMVLQKGDIVWYNRNGQGHTEMVYDPVNRWTMGAKGRGREWGLPPTKSAEQQVAIGEYNTDTWYTWQKLARDVNAQGFNWIYKDEYMSEDESWNNATLAGAVLASQGYSMQAICGILGNMMAESGVQPILNERGGGGGYGLVQWTPKSDLINVVGKYALGDYTKGDVQCTAFDYECGVRGTNEQWYDIYPHKPQVPFTDFATWKNRTDYSPAQMAYAFMSFYERPDWATCHLERRMEWAEKFYARFKDTQFNGVNAFDFGSFGNGYIYLIDYVRRKNNLLIQ